VPLVRLVAYLPAMLAGVVAARAAAKLESRWPLKGSTWQSVERARPTEIDYLNGEIVRSGKDLHVPTPLNEIVVSLERHRPDGRRYFSAHEVELAFARSQLPEATRRLLASDLARHKARAA
jgi:hypothetical protein